MNIDEFDYKEPCCPLSDGKDFYYPREVRQHESIPVDRIISRLDEYFSHNDLTSAEALLDYWLKEAVDLSDYRGELSVLNEFTGLYRKTGNKEKSEKINGRIFDLLNILDLKNTVSGATILLNVATNKKAFGDPQGAIDLYLEAADIYASSLKPDDPLFGGLYNNFALALADTGDFEKAYDYFDKALSIVRKNKNLPDCAVTYCNIAVTKLLENPLNDEESDNALDDALKRLDDPDVVKDGYYAFVCDKCAAAFGECGRFADAADLKERARKIYERN